ncbi:hypothetical protein M8C21_026508, partial [Ambrosia artemisiifolia]
MSQVDNRNSSSSVKRARTDGGRREDDWTCPSCGNVNFSFRTSCNMRNCTQPRPADHNSKSAPRQMPTPQGGYSSAYTGSAAPASMYVGVPPYGASLLNGTSMPSYDAPLSGGSAYNYIYNNRLAGGSPYRPLQLSGTPPYSGGIYGLPQLMEQFGLRLPMGQTALGPRPGFYSEETSQKKDGSRENDWECPQCGNVNFAFRTVCNMRKCNTPKPGSQAAQLSKSSNKDMPEGSWKCDKCNNINYPFRTQCNRKNCGADKPESQNSPPEEENNDQIDILEILPRFTMKSELVSCCSVWVESQSCLRLCVAAGYQVTLVCDSCRQIVDCVLKSDVYLNWEVGEWYNIDMAKLNFWVLFSFSWFGHSSRVDQPAVPVE